MRTLSLLVPLSFAGVAHADCYDDVFASYDCTYDWNADCDAQLAACDAALAPAAATPTVTLTIANGRSQTLYGGALYPLVQAYEAEVAASRAATLAKFQAAASAGWRTSARAYYLTPDSYYADELDLACDAGFHVASLAELTDGVSLVYDLGRGALADDGSWGPPGDMGGHVLTGTAYDSCYGSREPSLASVRAVRSGQLNTADLGASSAHHGGGWSRYVEACSRPAWVWCVQD